jgi:O-antigen/teichoic acid export membrane protein
MIQVDKGARKQLPINLLSNFGLLAANILVGLWMIPYLIGKLGVAGYGLVPLANQITNYATLITLAVNGSVSRFLAIEIKRNDTLKANQIFNTAFYALAALLIALVPLAAIFSYFVPIVFDIPTQHTYGVRVLFLCIMGTFIVTTFRGNFSVSPFALNRLDIRNTVDLVNVLARAGLIVLFFRIVSVSVAQVGMSYLLSALLALGMSVYFWKKLTPQLSVHRAYFDRGVLKDLTSTGGWLVVNQIGTLLFLNIDLIVVNKLFGAVSAGSYSAILQWSTLLRMMGGAVAGAFTPMVIGYFALNQHDKIIQFSRQTVKFTSVILALPIGGLCGFSAPLLNIWLGPDFVQYAPLMCLMLFHLPVNLGVLPLFNINVASNKVKTPGWVTLAMGIVNALLAVTLPLAFGWGVYGVAAAGAIVLTLKNALFTPWYASRVLGTKATTFNRAMLPGMVGMVFVAAMSFTVSSLFSISGWFALILAGTPVAAVYLLVCWIWGLDTAERQILLGMLPRRLKP